MVEAVELTGRAAEVYERMQRDMQPQEIADELGISRNAVYQHIGRLKRDGIIPDDSPSPPHAPARRQPRAAREGSVLTEVQRLAQRMEQRLDDIDAEVAQLGQERERITVTLAALEPVITPESASPH